MDTGEELRKLILSVDFTSEFVSSLVNLICISKISDLRWRRWTFYLLQKFAAKTIRRLGTGKTSFNFHGIFHIDTGKNDSTGEPRSFELSLFKCCLHLHGALFVTVDWSCFNGNNIQM